MVSESWIGEGQLQHFLGLGLSELQLLHTRDLNQPTLGSHFHPRPGARYLGSNEGGECEDGW